MHSSEALTGVVQRLRTTVDDAPSDRELLARYVGHDQAAFEALVRRHGALVLGVAHRQLADPQQAEDVFQATFLALARSTAKLSQAESLAGWLYTVALRQTRKARVRSARSWAREQAVARPPIAPTGDPLAEISGRELVAAVDEELARLPEAYKLPLLLCYMQGLSREEAARQLGWPKATVRGRLERGRQRLAARLARRGLAPAALLIAPVTGRIVAEELLTRTVGLAAAPWSQAIPAAVSALTVAAAPSRFVPTVVLLGSLLVAGVIGLAAPPSEEKPAAPAPATATAPPADSAKDPLPEGGLLRFGTARFRHSTFITNLAVTPDGRVAVAACDSEEDRSARAFDLATGQMFYSVAVAKEASHVESIGLAPDGRTLVTRQGDTLSVRDAGTGEEQRRIDLPKRQAWMHAPWLALPFTPDGRFVALAASGPSIHLVDLNKGEVARSFPYHDACALAISSDGMLLAGGGHDLEGNNYMIRLWEVSTGKQVGRLAAGPKGMSSSLAFSPDGTLLASGHDSTGLRLWDVQTGKEVRTLTADRHRIRSIAFSPDGKTIAAAGGSIRLYDSATGEERLCINHEAVGLHFSADGKTLTGAVASAIHRWDVATGKVLTPHDASNSSVDLVAAAPDGRRVVTGDRSGYIHIWDGLTGQHLQRFENPYRCFALSPDGRLLAWPVLDERVQYKSRVIPKSVLAGIRIKLYDLAAGTFVERFPGFKSCGRVTFNDADGVRKIDDIGSWFFGRGLGAASTLRFSADGSTLLTVDHLDLTVRAWDVASGQERHSFCALPEDEELKTYAARRSVISPDGRLVAVVDDVRCRQGGSGSMAVWLWDVATGQQRGELNGHAGQLHSLSFSPDGRLLATAGPVLDMEKPGSDALPLSVETTERVMVWDIATGKPVASLPKGLPGRAVSVEFSSDGRTLATASVDGVIRVWEVATWSERMQFRGHKERVAALAFAPGGRLFSGSADTTVLAWDVLPRRPADTGDPATAWDALTNPEARSAFKAMGQLRAAPVEAVSIIAQQLQPAKPVDLKRIPEWIAALDSLQFATRQQAAGALRRAGPAAEEALREAKEKSTSAEVRERAGNLLAELQKPTVSPEDLQALRAVETLEVIGTPEARRLLTELTKGDSAARLTKAAEEALLRLRPSGRD